MPPGCTTGTRDVGSGSRWAWSAPAPGGRTDGRPDLRTPVGRHRLGGGRTWIPVLSDRSRGGRGSSGQKEVGAAGGRRRGRLSRRGDWSQEPGSGLCGKEAKDGQRRARSGAGGARAGNAVRKEDSVGMGTASRDGLGHEGDAGAGSGQRAVSAPHLNPPPPRPPRDLLPRSLPVSAALGSAAARGLDSPERP